MDFQYHGHFVFEKVSWRLGQSVCRCHTGHDWHNSQSFQTLAAHWRHAPFIIRAKKATRVIAWVEVCAKGTHGMKRKGPSRKAIGFMDFWCTDCIHILQVRPFFRGTCPHVTHAEHWRDMAEKPSITSSSPNSKRQTDSSCWGKCSFQHRENQDLDWSSCEFVSV